MGLARDTRLLAAAQALWGVGFGILGPIWPLYLGELGASPSDIGVVLGTGLLVAALAIVPAGVAADRIGRRPLLVASGISGVAGALAFVPLTDWRGAFVGAVLYEGALVGLPVVTAHVASIEGRERMGSAMGLVYAAFFAGIIVGAPASGVIAATGGARAALVAGALLFVASTILLARTREERGERRVEIEAGGLRAIGPLLAVTPFAALVSQLPVPLLPVFLRGPAAVPLEQVGLYVGLFSVGSAVFSAAGGRLFDRAGTVVSVVSLSAVFALGGTVLAVGAGQAALGVGALLLGANIATNPALAAALEQILPPARAASGYAAFTLAFTIGQSAAAVAAGWLYEADALLPLLVAAALALPAGAVVAIVVRTLVASRGP